MSGGGEESVRGATASDEFQALLERLQSGLREWEEPVIRRVTRELHGTLDHCLYGSPTPDDEEDELTTAGPTIEQQIGVSAGRARHTTLFAQLFDHTEMSPGTREASDDASVCYCLVCILFGMFIAQNDFAQRKMTAADKVRFGIL